MDEQFRQFDNYRLGDCENEVLYNDFCFAGARGLTLGEDATTGPSGVCFGTAFDQNTIDLEAHRISPSGFPIVNGQFCCVGEKDFPASCYVHTTPEFTGTLSMVENDLFARPRQAVLLEGGKVEMQLATISGAGAVAFVPHGGQIESSNLFLEKPSQVAPSDSAANVKISGVVYAKGVTGPPNLDEVVGEIAANVAHGSAIGSQDMLGGTTARATTAPTGLSWRLPGLAPGKYRFELLTGDSGGEGSASFELAGAVHTLDVLAGEARAYDLGTCDVQAGHDAVVTLRCNANSPLTDAIVRAIPIPAGISEGEIAAWSILGEHPVDYGLVPIMKTDEGYATAVVAGGRPAVRVPTATLRAKSGPFLYFSVEDTRLNGGTAGESVELLIKYFDEGQGEIGVQFDADGEGNGFQTAPATIRLTNSQTWKTGSIVLAHPQFANRTNGHDFRITMSRENPPAIASVAIIKGGSNGAQR